MTIEFYYNEISTPCRFVQLLAKYLNIQLNPIYLDLIQKKEHLTPEFLKINPEHCIPTIVDNGFVLWESSAIAPYLIQKYATDDSLYPNDFQKQATINQRLHFNGVVLTHRLGEYYHSLMRNAGIPDQEKYKKAQEAFEILETLLNKHEYVAGESLTVADLAIGTTVATYDVAKFDRSTYKKVASWMNKMKSFTFFEEFNDVEKISKVFAKFSKK